MKSSITSLKLKKKSKITNWSFFPIQYYNTKLSNRTLQKWSIQKDTSIDEIYYNITKSQKPRNSTNSINNILGKREIKTPSEKDLNVLYIDKHIIVINKPSGILSVPGPNRKPSILDTIYTNFAYPNTNPDQMVSQVKLI